MDTIVDRYIHACLFIINIMISFLKQPTICRKIFRAKQYDHLSKKIMPRRHFTNNSNIAAATKLSSSDSSSDYSSSSSSSFIKNVNVNPVPIRTRKEAMKALEILFNNKEKIHACDTEVCNIDLSKQGPVGNGQVTCATIYSGPDVDFGSGPGGTLWIDNVWSDYIVLQKVLGEKE